MNWLRAYIGTDIGMSKWSKEQSADYPPEHFEMALAKILDCFAGVCIARDYNFSDFYGSDVGGMQIPDSFMRRNFAQSEWKREGGDK